MQGGVPPLPVGELSIDRLVAEGRVCMGNPDECAAVVERARDALGLDGARTARSTLVASTTPRRGLPSSCSRGR